MGGVGGGAKGPAREHSHATRGLKRKMGPGKSGGFGEETECGK